MPRILRTTNVYLRTPSMGGMNVTPFIDVLLVLLVMLILSVPIATHKTEIALPAGPSGNADPITNTVHIDASDRLFWNGASVTRDELRANLQMAATLPNEPLLRFEPAALASYDLSAKTITLIKDTGATKFAFVGNEKHRNFGR